MNPLALTVGYTHNGNGYDARIVQSSGEDVFRVSADAVGSSWATFRVQYEVGSRTGSGLDEQALIDIGEHPEMRHYDLADRTRNRFTGQIDIVPSDVWMFSVSGGILHDDYGDTVFGLQESTGRTFSLAADYHLPNGLGAGATYNLERYTGLQQSHEGDSSDAQFNDPLRNWTADSTETVHYFSIYATPPRIGRNTEVRFWYDFSHADGNYLYTIPAGSPIPTPNQLPDVFNKLQQLHIDARYRMTKNLAGTFSYLYEPLKIYDYAFDPSVVNGIVQPSSLVMGYVYRPVHREFVRVRHSVSSGRAFRSIEAQTSGRHACRRVTSSDQGLFVAAVAAPLVVRALAGSRARPGRPVKKGAEGLRGAEMLGLPRHRRQRQQDESARRRRARSCRPTTSEQWIVDPVAMATKAKSTKKPPMPAKYAKLPAADIDALVAYMQSLK